MFSFERSASRAGQVLNDIFCGVGQGDYVAAVGLNADVSDALARKTETHYRAEIVPVTDVGKFVLLYSHGAQRAFVGIYCKNFVRVVALDIVGDAEHDYTFSSIEAAPEDEPARSRAGESGRR